MRLPAPRFLLLAGALAAALFVAGCGGLETDSAGQASRTTRTAPSPPPAIHPRGERARALRAVSVLDRALRNADVEQLCRPGAVFTSPVVTELNEGGVSCEASLEVLPLVRRPPELTVTKLAFKPGLATASVRLGSGHRTVPLDVVRDGRRWLVSFSDGANPLVALAP